MAASGRDRCSSRTTRGCWRTRRRRIEAKRERLAALFVDASPSARSMRAGPDYRVAMLHVLGLRAVETAIERLAPRRTGAR